MAQERGKTPLVVILPHDGDIRYFRQRGTWPYEHVVKQYEQAGIDFIDFGPYMVSICEQTSTPLSKFVGPTGHFNDQGNARIAEFVTEALQKRDLLP